MKRLAKFLRLKQYTCLLLTKIELFAFSHLNEKEQEVIEAIIEESHIIFAGYKITETAITLRSKYNLKIPDAIIGASAKNYGLPLLTADTDFSRLSEIDLVRYKSF